MNVSTHLAIATRWLCMLFVAAIVGCGQPKTKVKGRSPNGEPRPLVAVLAGETPSRVVIRGVLVEKCPVAGCWFRLIDDDRVIKVDTKTAGFVVTDIPLKTVVTVGGRIIHEGNQTTIEATGLRY